MPSKAMRMTPQCVPDDHDQNRQKHEIRDRDEKPHSHGPQRDPSRCYADSGRSLCVQGNSLRTELRYTYTMAAIAMPQPTFNNARESAPDLLRPDQVERPVFETLEMSPVPALHGARASGATTRGRSWRPRSTQASSQPHTARPSISPAGGGPARYASMALAIRLRCASARSTRATSSIAASSSSTIMSRWPSARIQVPWARSSRVTVCGLTLGLRGRVPDPAFNQPRPSLPPAGK